MIVFTYDGSFEGFLTCVYEGYYSSKPEKIIKKSSYIVNFLDEEVLIETSEEKYTKVYRAIEDKLGEEILKKIYTAYLSDVEESYTVIFNYIVLAFKMGPKINMYKHNTFVDKMDKIECRVREEAHRFKGILRFKDLNGILYSKIDPDNDIVEFIMGHFINRFSNEKFIIYDEKRDKAIIYNGKVGNIIINAKQELQGIGDLKDDFYEDLWRTYFKSTNIKERENKNLQRKMMPKRYWKNILEADSSK